MRLNALIEAAKDFADISGVRLPPTIYGMSPDHNLLIREWIDECVQNHHQCKADEKQFLPRRLLDLFKFDSSDDLALIETMSMLPEKIEYMTLSHCWGSSCNHPAKTKKANLDQHMSCVKFDQLSLTLRDAVKIVRSLCVRYV